MCYVTAIFSEGNFEVAALIRGDGISSQTCHLLHKNLATTHYDSLDIRIG